MILIASIIITSVVIIMAILTTRKNTPFTSTSLLPKSVQVASSTLDVSGVKVNNFYRESKEIDKQGDQDLVPIEKDYDIIYLAKTKSFLISILASPFEDMRKKAEEKFLEKLKVDKETACKLDVGITTPSFVNLTESGQTYKLSFCTR